MMEAHARPLLTMDPIVLLGSVGFPLVLAIGGILAWRKSRQTAQIKPAAAGTWRDDSLDDWRKQREAELEAEREQRAKNPSAPSDATTRTGESEAEVRTTHTRLGG
jgi:hypothetical protein